MKLFDLPDPSPEELKDPLFNVIWEAIKTWDINVGDGYTGCMGSHAKQMCDSVTNAIAVDGSILSAIKSIIDTWGINTKEKTSKVDNIRSVLYAVRSVHGSEIRGS